MKKVSIIGFVLAILMLLNIGVFASEPQITIEGESTVKPGETKTATVKVSSQDIEVGVVSGKIEKSENIDSIIVAGKNGWNLTYNQQTGVFNILKAEGAKSESILDIQYTLKNEEGTAKITIKDIELATIDYLTTEIAEVSKEITVKNEQQNPGEEPEVVTLTGIKVKSDPTKVIYTVGEKFDKAGLVVEAEYSDGTSKEVTNYTYAPSGELELTDTKITITYIENDVTKTVEQSITVKNVNQDKEPDNKAPEDAKPNGNKPVEDNKKDDTQADKNLDKAGVEGYTITMVAVIAIVAVISFKKYKKYKNI